jgi:Kdo2-lipid IVA lauroyltransferase/acyltransferase
MSTLGIWFMRAIAPLPLAWVRLLGAALGVLLYWVVLPRRKVALTNLRLCFPQWDEPQLRRVARQHFRVFAQAWLDRSWLWHGSPHQLRERLKITGDTGQFANPK